MLKIILVTWSMDIIAYGEATISRLNPLIIIINLIETIISRLGATDSRCYTMDVKFGAL